MHFSLLQLFLFSRRQEMNLKVLNFLLTFVSLWIQHSVLLDQSLVKKKINSDKSDQIILNPILSLIVLLLYQVQLLLKNHHLFSKFAVLSITIESSNSSTILLNTFYKAGSDIQDKKQESTQNLYVQKLQLFLLPM